MSRKLNLPVDAERGDAIMRAAFNMKPKPFKALKHQYAEKRKATKAELVKTLAALLEIFESGVIGGPGFPQAKKARAVLHACGLKPCRVSSVSHPSMAGSEE